MDIGHRLRSVREEKKVSRGDIEQRTGLLRCCISRVENGHTVPAIETPGKLARGCAPMPRKVKTNIFMSPRQMADLIRRGVDWVIAQYLSEQLKVVGRADKYKVKARQPSKSIN